MNKIARGIITPILTPMYDDESINYEELKNQVERLIAAGVSGLFVFGTNGESYVLNEEERRSVLKTVVEQTAKRVPVFAGAGFPGTKETIRQSLIAKDLGADALSLLCPYFAAANQNEIYSHFASVNREVDLPVVIYNIPARTGNKVAPETIERLANDCEHIVGVKDSSGDFLNTQNYIVRTSFRDDFSVLAGNDALILDTLVNGGAGAIAGCSNIYPKTICSIYTSFLAGDLDAALKAQRSLIPLRNTFRYGNPNTMIKCATRMLGYPVGSTRAPFNGISPEGIEALRKVLDDGKRLGME
ncbi:MAG: 4-hydroxy-tetrahydrodipicolinate synthase [Lachnospiraceae bacterium]|nr:4-hydroxy-tetrahydrodipicolinate synthase [Lachnospiraceae bacterium]